MARRADKSEEQLIDSGKYYDVLDGFDSTIQKLNMKAADGETVNRLQARCQKLVPAFIALCGVDITQLPKAEPEPSKPEPPKPKPRTMLQSTLQAMDGWGMCPKCGKRCIKVNENTILVNYPMFCKVCRRDYVVTWRFER